MRVFGISLRQVEATGYIEPRDALAQSWFPFLRHCLPTDQFILLPNIGSEILNYVQSLDLRGFILSGGEDLGIHPQRDLTERTVLKLAIQKRLPVLGVCRGLQLIADHYGFHSTRVCEKTHVASRHSLIWSQNFAFAAQEVNSYHKNGLSVQELAQSPLEVLAYSPDQVVECIQVQDYPIWGVSWHPEREEAPQRCDQILLQHVFVQE